MTKTELAQILHRAERFTLDNGTDELSIRTEDITRELLALANGYKYHGGNVYILQTLNLRAITFDCSERNEALWFASWAMPLVD